MSVSVLIAPEDLLGLGPLVSESATPLSPYRAGESSALGDMQRARLIRNGVLDSSGAILPAHAGPLGVLGRASAVSGVRLTGDRLFDYSVYFDGGDDAVSLLSADDGVLVESPPPVSNALAHLANAIGTSEIIGVEISIDFKAAEALVFAAMVDDHRRATFRALADDAEVAVEPATAARVDELLARTGGYLSAAAVLGLALDSPVVPGRETIEAALGSLAGAGHVRRVGQGYLLAPPGAALAGRMLTLERVFSLIAGQQQGTGDPSWAGLTCLVAGHHDILSIEATVDGLRLATISASTLLRMTEVYLTRMHLAEPVPSSAPAPETTCRTCGSELISGGKFCGACGTTVG